jgi:hypothetical protein
MTRINGCTLFSLQCSTPCSFLFHRPTPCPLRNLQSSRIGHAKLIPAQSDPTKDGYHSTVQFNHTCPLPPYDKHNRSYNTNLYKIGQPRFSRISIALVVNQTHLPLHFIPPLQLSTNRRPSIHLVHTTNFYQLSAAVRLVGGCPVPIPNSFCRGKVLYTLLNCLSAVK